MNKPNNRLSSNILRPFLPFFLLFFAPFIVQTQTCEGNLGENIFESGDFGSGIPNIPSEDPFIALDFTYSTNPPPNDGYYTITNDMNAWPSVFGTWIRVNDNSSDPNGYMMVVNANYTPGLFYEQEITGLCDNTLYVFSADVINLISTGTDFIRPNISFLINDEIFYTTGDIPEDEQWKTYGFTFTTTPGQNTILLSLRNNAPGGLGNDVALDNITFRPCGPEALILPLEIANICEDGEPIQLDATVIGDHYDTPAFQWQYSPDEGNTWQNIVGENGPIYNHTNLESGFYYYRYLLANGMDNLMNSKCRVVSNTKIVHVTPKHYSIVDTICEGLIFTVGNSKYDQTGLYVDSLISSIGCDSIISLDLTIVPDTQIEVAYDVTPPSCSDYADGNISLTNIINQTLDYTAFIDDFMLPIPGIYANLASGDYSLHVSDHYGCFLDTTIHIPSPPPFKVELGPDLTVELGEEVSITAFLYEEHSSIFWQPNLLNENCAPDCLNIQWTPERSLTVDVIASSIHDCPASDSLFITVLETRKVYIPNVFSPNSDGINDRFTVLGATPNIQEIEKFLIFNRWGSLIFEQYGFQPNENSKGWDGSYNGQPLGADIFLYYAEIRFLDGKVIEYTGDVNLLR